MKKEIDIILYGIIKNIIFTLSDTTLYYQLKQKLTRLLNLHLRFNLFPFQQTFSYITIYERH